MQILVMDVGGSSVKYALCDLNGNLTEQGKHKGVPGPQGPYEDFLAIIRSITDKLAGRFDGIAVSMPGCIDSKRGYCFSGGALTFNAGHYLARDITEFAGVPCVIENDGKAAARAELWKGSLRGVTNGAVMGFGTGLAGGIIIDGKMLSGPTGAAGELSFFLTDDEKVADHEHLGAMHCSTSGLLRLAAIELGLPYCADYTRGIQMPLDGEEFFRRVNQGDERMLRCLKKFGEYVGALIYNVSVVIDAEKIALGGGISVQESVITAVREGLETVYQKHVVPRQYNIIHQPEVVACTFHNEANLLGAVHCLGQYFPQFKLNAAA